MFENIEKFIKQLNNLVDTILQEIDSSKWGYF